MGRILITLFTLACFTACTTLQPLADNQPATIRQSVQPGDTVEVELANGEHHVVTVKSVDDQALAGTENGAQRSIALADIRSIGTREVTGSSKLWIGVGIAAVLAAVLAGGGGGGGGSGY